MQILAESAAQYIAQSGLKAVHQAVRSSLQKLTIKRYNISTTNHSQYNNAHSFTVQSTHVPQRITQCYLPPDRGDTVQRWFSLHTNCVDFLAYLHAKEDKVIIYTKSML